MRRSSKGFPKTFALTKETELWVKNEWLTFYSRNARVPATLASYESYHAEGRQTCSVRNKGWWPGSYQMRTHFSCLGVQAFELVEFTEIDGEKADGDQLSMQAIYVSLETGHINGATMGCAHGGAKSGRVSTYEK